MNNKVSAKQHNSKMCFVCGLKNPHGVKAAFYEMENGDCVALFKPCEEHQGYPGRLHGGVAASILDEGMGRGIMALYPDNYWGVTAELTIRYKKPVPLGETLRVVCRITAERGRLFEGEGRLLLSDGTVAIEGKGKYFKMATGTLGLQEGSLEWAVTPTPDDPTEIEY